MLLLVFLPLGAVGRLAVATLAAARAGRRLPPGYVLGAVYVGTTARRVLPAAVLNETDIVVLVGLAGSGQVAESEVAVFREAGMMVRFCEGVGVSRTELANTVRRKAEWTAVWYLKVHLFGMTDYERVIYLDADSYWVYDFSAFFRIQDCSLLFARGGLSPINAGFISLRPSSRWFDDLKRLVEHRFRSTDETWLQTNWLGAATGTAPRETCDDGEQGMMYCYFFRNGSTLFGERPREAEAAAAVLKWGSDVEVWRAGARSRELNLENQLLQLGWRAPYEHFGGRFKPWALVANGRPLCLLDERSLRGVVNHGKGFKWTEIKIRRFRRFCREILATPTLRDLYGRAANVTEFPPNRPPSSQRRRRRPYVKHLLHRHNNKPQRSSTS